MVSFVAYSETHNASKMLKCFQPLNAQKFHICINKIQIIVGDSGTKILSFCISDREKHLRA